MQSIRPSGFSIVNVCLRSRGYTDEKRRHRKTQKLLQINHFCISLGTQKFCLMVLNEQRVSIMSKAQWEEATAPHSPEPTSRQGTRTHDVFRPQVKKMFKSDFYKNTMLILIQTQNLSPHVGCPLYTIHTIQNTGGRSQWLPRIIVDTWEWRASWFLLLPSS